jgi:hypothetical protein
MSASTSAPPSLPPSAAQVYARALWDPKPTTTGLSQRQLAYALGYPDDWRVERALKQVNGKIVLVDCIHATGKNGIAYTWFHHEAALQAAAHFEQEGALPGSSHLMPPLPLYTKGDVIQVYYENKWYAATIVKRKKQGDNFLYSIFYNDGNETQDDVTEQDMQPGEDPSELAQELGFPDDWKATRKGARYILTAPTGERFTTKKAALKFLQEQQAPAMATEAEEGDPPWRLEGHELIGKTIHYSTTHKVSGTRRITVDQVGIVTGYIDTMDVDKQGNPGFISEATGKPANLFNVVFKDDGLNHPYAHHLLASQDLEEEEVRQCLAEIQPSPKKKQKTEPAPSTSNNKGRGRPRRSY